MCACVYRHVNSMYDAFVHYKGARKRIKIQATQPTTLCLILSESITVCVYWCVLCVSAEGRESGWARGRKCRAQRVWVGTLFSTERSPLFSTGCLPHHRSYQATLHGLNGLAGMAAGCPPPPPPPEPDFCLFFTASSSFSFCPSSSPPYTSMLFHFLLCFLHLFLCVMAPTSTHLYKTVLSSLPLSIISISESSCFDSTLFTIKSTQWKISSTFSLSCCFPLTPSFPLPFSSPLHSFYCWSISLARCKLHFPLSKRLVSFCLASPCIYQWSYVFRTVWTQRDNCLSHCVSVWVFVRECICACVTESLSLMYVGDFSKFQSNLRP